MACHCFIDANILIGNDGGHVSHDNLVSIVTYYALDAPGIESQLGQDFLHLFRLALGPPNLL